MSAFEELRSNGSSAELESEAIFGPGAGLVTLAPDATGLRVPWARFAERIVVPGVGTFARTDVEINPGENLAGAPRDTVRFDPSRSEPLKTDPATLFMRATLVRASLMAGALDLIRDLTLDYAQEREQFGRPIARFQAVQEHLVTVAQQAALVGVAVSAAVRRQETFEIGAAKLLANRAAFLATRAAHQVHGARGTTLANPLGAMTKTLWSLRTECGDDRYWARRLGAAVARAGADALYPAITGGSAVVEEV